MAPRILVAVIAMVLAVPAASIHIGRIGTIKAAALPHERRKCTKPVVDVFSKKYNQAIHRRVGYECSGRNYESFSKVLDSFALNFTSNAGRRTLPLPANSTILTLGNSHMRQLIQTLVCQYADKVVDNSFDFKFGTERGDAFMVQFENNATLFSLTNCPIVYSKKWPQLVENIIGRSISSLDGIVLGAFNGFDESLNTSFKKAVLKATQGMDEVSFATIPPPSLLDVATIFDGPIVYTSMFAVQGTSRRDDAIATKAALYNRTNIEVIDSRKYIESIGVECGTDIEDGSKQDIDCDNNKERSSHSHRCTGIHGGHVDLVAWDVIEALHTRFKASSQDDQLQVGVQAAPDVELVVNAWNENLDFVDSMFTGRIPNSKASIYCNGPILKDPRCIRAPNFGTENWVYLNHIIENYDKLANITVFTLGSIDSKEWVWLKCRKLNFVLSKLDTEEKQTSFPGFSSMAHYDPGIFLPWNSNFNIEFYRPHVNGAPEKNCAAAAEPLGAFYQKFVEEDESWPETTGMQYNGIFAARRETIHLHPKRKYEALRKELERCGENVALVADHYVERLWKPMLDRDGVDEDRAAANSCPRAPGAVR